MIQINYKKAFALKILFVLLSLTGFSQNLIDDNFTTASSDWQGINISGSGSFDISGGVINVTANSNSIYAAYNTEVLSGHFYVEVDFGQDDNVGLALLKANSNGTPDSSNFSIIKVDEVNGVPEVSITDRQFFINDILDNSGALSSAEKSVRYKNTLDGNTYSIPYTSTNKKLRIFRHENEEFIHFYYNVSKIVDGEEVTGWVELAPSKEWPQLNGNFLMGLVAFNGSATFDNAYAVQKPLQDQNDANTGFAATWREVNWSGYFGDALVVTFDNTDAPITGGTRKFVFWEAFNNVPAWYLDEDVMYTYEFVETWGGGNPGPHEPMSDRLLAYSDVSLDYDGSDYKLIHWQYTLIDPDYKWPDFNQGTERPIVDEYYKIYPDGRILRKIRYKAKLDSSFRNWHELTELIVISGNSTDPSDHLDSPALSIWPINDQKLDFNPTGPGNDYEQSHNDATILAVHMNNHPDLVNVFNDNSSSHDTYTGDPISVYKTWHDINFRMSHWPIGKEQYYTDTFKSVTTWTEQVKHTSIGGAGVHENSSDQWSNNYQIDPVDGREYREWISYMSLSNDLNQTKTEVEEWLGDPWDLTSNSPLDNLAFNKPITTSSVHGNFNLANEAIDNDDESRWESQHGSDEEWIYVDLGANYFINTAVILWEDSYSSVYDIQTSNDAITWTTVYSDTDADGGLDVINLDNIDSRYIRVYGYDRATQYGHSIYEFKVYGSISTTLSIQDANLDDSIGIYPNPIHNNDDLNIFLKNGSFLSNSKIEIQIVSASGQIVLKNSFNNFDYNAPLSVKLDSLTNGVYFLRLVSGEKIYLNKVVISN